MRHRACREGGEGLHGCETLATVRGDGRYTVDHRFANSSPSSLHATGSDTHIAITDTGFDPAIVTILPGESVHWTNESGETQSVTSDGGLFDSGDLAPGAGFSMALAIPAFHTYQSTTNPDFTGEVRVVLDALPGPSDELANELDAVLNHKTP